MSSIDQDLNNFPESQKSLNISDLFGFSDAQKIIEGKPPEILEEPSFLPNRVFINHLDSFFGREITQFLSDQKFGAKQTPKEDEDDEEDEEDVLKEEEKEGIEKLQPKDLNYEIIGTVQDPDFEIPEDVKEIIRDPSDRESFKKKVLSCGFIIFDITRSPDRIEELMTGLAVVEDYLSNMRSATPKAYKNLAEQRVFVLVSSVLTWALTKPVDPEEPDSPFIESDYRKRKPHPNFSQHAAFEKELLRTGRKNASKLKALVAAAGVMYGGREDALHFLFEMAWLGQASLPVFGPGRNIVPLIHVKDLANIVYNIFEEFPEEIRYLLAVESPVATLNQITRAISKTLGTGKTNNVSIEEAFLLPQITQQVYDMVTQDRNMEPVFVSEMGWLSERSFVENIRQVVEEYKEARGLRGRDVARVWRGLFPPASLKTPENDDRCMKLLPLAALATHCPFVLARQLSGKGAARGDVNVIVAGSYNFLCISFSNKWFEIKNVFFECWCCNSRAVLQPVKIFVHGPPAVGKTELSRKLCAHYRLHHLTVESVVEAGLRDLVRRGDAAGRDASREAREGRGRGGGRRRPGWSRPPPGSRQQPEEEEEEAEDREELRERLDAARAGVERTGRPDDELLLRKGASGCVPVEAGNAGCVPPRARFLRERLASHPCQNQGYVLDGVPWTTEQARELFAPPEDQEGEEEEETAVPFSRTLMPEYAVSLEASDDFLWERVVDMPEKQLQASPYAEEKMVVKLSEFRQNNTEELTVMNFFDEAEIHCMIYNIEKDQSEFLEATFQDIIAKIGKPRNYGPSAEERAQTEQETEEKRKAEQLEKEQEEERIQKKIQEEEMAKMEEWATLLNALKEEEATVLAVRGIPMREFLVKNVFPVLTKGLIEVARTRPSDPVDFLAVYLFTNNPDGKMFQTEYMKASVMQKYSGQ
ncbi:adenylate kinase 7-like [Bacillus rossius redtenbacheri]|uniref:adenylate kinase 7-like n=1 Tax=Bacillus rossius redtenbacheri TaxID=93214 RepID=UPI002FDE1B57